MQIALSPGDLPHRVANRFGADYWAWVSELQANTAFVALRDPRPRPPFSSRLARAQPLLLPRRGAVAVQHFDHSLWVVGDQQQFAVLFLDEPLAHGMGDPV